MGELEGAMNATLTILGCGSAIPTRKNNPSGQILEMRDKQFLIDCGEGIQITMRQTAQRTSRLDHIFISHLHGDHCFGLIGLISTLAMMGRTRNLYIHAQPDLEKLLRPQIDYFCNGMAFEIIFCNFNPRKHEIIYEDRSLTVKTLPLKHRVPCCGFLFEEKQKERHIIKEMIDKFDIPLSAIPAIKEGADFMTEVGVLITNDRLTTDPTPPIRYAYCSDTAYLEKLIPLIEGVDCLYHEATFTKDMADRAKETQHSTARQAATIAQKAGVKKLIIGHFSARVIEQNIFLEEAKAVFPNTYLAKERETYSIG